MELHLVITNIAIRFWIAMTSILLILHRNKRLPEFVYSIYVLLAILLLLFMPALE